MAQVVGFKEAIVSRLDIVRVLAKVCSRRARELNEKMRRLFPDHHSLMFIPLEPSWSLAP